MLAGLVLVDLVTVEPETSKAGGRTIKVVRMQIADAGRYALADEC